MSTITTPPADHAPRLASWRAADFPVPTGREEEWRFTPLDRLGGLLGDASADAVLKLSYETPSGAAVETVDAADARASSGWIPTDRLAARAHEGAADVLLITVDADVELIEPIEVSLVGVGGMAFQRVLIRVGANSRAVVILEHSGSTTVAANVEAVLADGAALTVVSVQDWADDAVHAGHLHAEVGRDATYRSIVVTLGGDLVRLVPTVRYAGPGGGAELLGVYFADAGQHLEHRMFVDHGPAHCRSRVTYKGALQGRDAHTVWIGDVLIRASAIGTDTYELNRNLVLTDGGRADSVPNLEIETGEIAGAGHASATGRFDDEQLFYLQSRGIDADSARRLVVLGFFAEVLDQIPAESLRERLLRAVESELGYQVDAASGSSRGAVL
jgi:Fe-S cluster assembly protein SufD